MLDSAGSTLVEWGRQQQQQQQQDKEDVSSALIAEMISKRNDLENFVEKYNPHPNITNRTVNIFNDNVKEHFRKILKHQQKQKTENFFGGKKNQHKANFT